MVATAGTVDAVTIAKAIEARATPREERVMSIDIAEAARRPRTAGPLDTRVVAIALGLFTTTTFLVCVLWGLVTPGSVHMKAALNLILPAFEWLTAAGFLAGLTESFLYGAYAGLVFCPIYNAVHRRVTR